MSMSLKDEHAVIGGQKIPGGIPGTLPPAKVEKGTGAEASVPSEGNDESNQAARPFVQGQRVRALWFPDSKWYAATIVSRDGDQYEVQFDDAGNTHQRLARHLMPLENHMPSLPELSGDIKRRVKNESMEASVKQAQNLFLRQVAHFPPQPMMMMQNQIKREPVTAQYDEAYDRTWNIWVGDLHADSTDEDLIECFKECGEIISAKVIRKNPHAQKRYGFVNFKTQQAQLKAVDEYQGKLIRNQPIVVKRQYSAEEQEGMADFDHAKSLFIGNIPRTITQNRLQQEIVRLGGPIQDMRLKNGYCFVLYRTKEAANVAQDRLRGVSMAGKTLTVQFTRSAEEQAAVQSGLDPEELERNRRTVYITGCTKDLSDDDIRRVFGEFGPLRNVYIPKNPDKTPRGFGFVEYARKKDADTAVQATNNSKINGVTIQVQVSKPAMMKQIMASLAFGGANPFEAFIAGFQRHAAMGSLAGGANSLPQLMQMMGAVMGGGMPIETQESLFRFMSAVFQAGRAAASQAPVQTPPQPMSLPPTPGMQQYAYAAQAHAAAAQQARPSPSSSDRRRGRSRSPRRDRDRDRRSRDRSRDRRGSRDRRHESGSSSSSTQQYTTAPQTTQATAAYPYGAVPGWPQASTYPYNAQQAAQAWAAYQQQATAAAAGAGGQWAAYPAAAAGQAATTQVAAGQPGQGSNIQPPGGGGYRRSTL